MMRRIMFAAACLAALPFLASAADAPTEQAAKATIQKLDDTLLETMKGAEKLGYKGRYDKLAPVLDDTFDLPQMARIAIGSQWSSYPADKQAALLDIFRRFTIATYASRFDGYDGESFETGEFKPTQGGDVIVNTLLKPRTDAPIQLNYRLRSTQDHPRVIDVYLTGTISQIATYRSDFSSTLKAGGPDALIAQLNGKIEQMQAAK